MTSIKMKNLSLVVLCAVASSCGGKPKKPNITSPTTSTQDTRSHHGDDVATTATNDYHSDLGTTTGTTAAGSTAGPDTTVINGGGTTTAVTPLVIDCPTGEHIVRSADATKSTPVVCSSSNFDAIGDIGDQNWTVGKAVSVSVDNHDDFPGYTYSEVGDLPQGVAFLNGVFLGTPTEVGSYTVTTTITDSVGQTRSHTFNITVVGIPIQLLSLDVQHWTVGTYVSIQLTATGGVPNPTYSITKGSTWPNWLSLDPGTGIVYGTPLSASSDTFQVTVTDSLGTSSSQTFSFIVADAAPIPPI